ncbi:MAG: hypothetical protein EOM23_01055 [Candidatus Moranbacteria bacterium]|nr:hypothetical protein [Candidatus Moranbacteria bacterium]
MGKKLSLRDQLQAASRAGIRKETTQKIDALTKQSDIISKQIVNDTNNTLIQYPETIPQNNTVEKSKKNINTKTEKNNKNQDFINTNNTLKQYSQTIPRNDTHPETILSIESIVSETIPLNDTPKRYPETIPLNDTVEGQIPAPKKIKGSRTRLRSKAHVRLAKFLLRNGPRIRTTKTIISESTGLDKQTILRAFKRFEKDGFLLHGPIKDPLEGLLTEVFIVNPDRYSNIPKMQKNDETRVSFRGIVSADKKERKNIFFLSNIKNKDLIRSIFCANSQNLKAIGFSEEHVHQALAERQTEELSPEVLALELEFLDVWAGTEEWLQGRKKHPVNSLFIMLVNGVRRPPGYKTKAERHLEYIEAEAKAQQEIVEKIENEAFDVWRSSLSSEELGIVMSGRLGPEKAWMKNYWKSKGKPLRGLTSSPA